MGRTVFLIGETHKIKFNVLLCKFKKFNCIMSMKELRVEEFPRSFFTTQIPFRYQKQLLWIKLSSCIIGPSYMAGALFDTVYNKEILFVHNQCGRQDSSCRPMFCYRLSSCFFNSMSLNSPHSERLSKSCALATEEFHSSTLIFLRFFLCFKRL